MAKPVIDAKATEVRPKIQRTMVRSVKPDDVLFELEGREAGTYASQGQLRAIMLAWKTAELAVLGRAHGDRARRCRARVIAGSCCSRADHRERGSLAHRAGIAGEERTAN